jgi:hypothetical protein
MVKIKVFVGNDHAILYSNRGLENPTLIGYVYEYEAEEEDAEYWNSLNSEGQEALVDEAEKGKTDLRLLLRKKRQRVDKASLQNQSQ